MALSHTKLKTGKVIINQYEYEDPYDPSYTNTCTEYFPTIENCKEFEGFLDIASEDKNIPWKLFERNEIPSLYTIRSKNEKGSSFECGLDLCDDKQFWLGLDRVKHPNMNRIKRILDEKYGVDKWFICIEEYLTKEN